MKRYNPKEIEPKWQQKWLDDQTFRVAEDPSKPKKYIIDMFPYPSGAAMHVGHVRNFTISDVLSQFHRQKGYNVMHTMGWDTFGLPAENYAIKTGTPPAETTKVNIANFKHQLQSLGMSYDWSREINTSDPSYYKWTQWIFTKLFENGLAYQKESPQWWCPVDKTVLANEQVENGRCWRCGNQVVKKNLKQWFFKITAYADQLLEDIDDLDWPEKIKTQQRNWIGRSQGAEITFKVDGGDEAVQVFTTRPDTIFGATFMVLAPEHELVSKITTPEQKEAVDAYVRETQKKSEIERQENKEKTGVFTGAYAINPANDQRIPIWIADYILMGYGTGAIMAVPAHDERDFEFAKKFDLPVKQVVAGYEVFTGINAPKDDVETLRRRTVDAIIRDQDGQYLLEVEGDQVHFVGGGADDMGDVSDEEAVRREVLEETGYTDVASIRQAAPFSAGIAYRHTKNKNQQTYGAYYEVVLASKQQLPSEVEEGKHQIRWVAKEDVANMLTWKWHLDAWEHYLENEPASFYEGEGILIHSGKYDWLNASEAREKIVADLEKKGAAAWRTNYKIRDWLISRQRYWGAPIPIIHCPEHGPVPVPEKDLPVVLPEVESFIPTDEGSVLAGVTDWVNTTCPICGKPAKRETDTMDGYACSSWYFLRYTDPHNDKQPWDSAKANYWLPIDYYCGGDHAVSHLLYSRFWMHFFADQGWIEKSRREPVGKLVYNGYILAYDGQKMSKSKGNVVNPDDLIEQGYGADSVRLFEMFIAPYDQNTNWNTNGVPGTFRFLQRVWTLTQKFLEASSPEQTVHSEDLLRATHRTIKAVTDDLEKLSFNTAVSSMMEYVNTLYKLNGNGFAAYDDWRFALESLTQLLAPFAPHISEELWHELGHTDSVHQSHWPQYDEKYLASDTMTIVVQVNGKMRAELSVAANAPQEVIVEAALNSERVQPFISGKDIKKTIYVPGRLVSLVV